MSYALQQVLFFLDCLVLAGVTVWLYFRMRVKQNALIRRTMRESDFVTGDPIFAPKSREVSRQLWRVMHMPQPDPETEALRNEMNRRARVLYSWMFGFPALVVAVVALIVYLSQAQ